MGVLLLALCICLGEPDRALAQQPHAEGEVLVPAPSSPEPEDGSEGPRVGLDDLLRLPSGYGADVQRRGGATPADWRARFALARQELDAAKKKLEELDAELEQMSGSSSAWAVSAPGSQDPQSSPLSLRLRQQVKEQRAQIQEAERTLRALHVEADLAGVPEEWRE